MFVSQVLTLTHSLLYCMMDNARDTDGANLRYFSVVVVVVFFFFFYSIFFLFFLLNSSATLSLSFKNVHKPPHLRASKNILVDSTTTNVKYGQIRANSTTKMSVRFGAKLDSHKIVSPTDVGSVGRRNLYRLPAAGCRWWFGVEVVTTDRRPVGGRRQAADLHSATNQAGCFTATQSSISKKSNSPNPPLWA
jgi:hypothetical protein